MNIAVAEFVILKSPQLGQRNSRMSPTVSELTSACSSVIGQIAAIQAIVVLRPKAVLDYPKGIVECKIHFCRRSPHLEYSTE
ncbi:hypothetical protein X770_11945 [Mesorhizobium sp. LSJC269B00]|nr:hypothetical protein X770_11945 [Mesorhizobium sp. LSJC269B00]ESZ59502.1 hypothetical protein X728_17200 [Mesorhizobium sp. L103C120A0]